MPKKIFEIASEVGLKPLDLVEKLKDLGYNVRNHMSSLEDGDVVKVLEQLGGGEEKQASTTKKKTTKKKTAKKKVAKKKAVTVRRKAPTKKKAAETVEAAPVEEKKTTTFAEAVEAQTAKESPEQTEQPVGENKEHFKEDAPKGLQVVSRPEVKKAEEPAPAEAKETEGSKKEYLEEKMHSFTPIFTPENKPEEKSASSTPGEPKSPADAESLDENGKKPETKKRLGGLAAMMAKPKGITRARELTQMRADEELKLYGSMSVLGKSVYTPVKRKRVYTGSGEKTKITEVKDSKRVVQIHKVCTALELAKKLSVKFKQFADDALDLNLLLAQDDYIGLELANELAQLYKYRVEDSSFNEEEVLDKEELTEEAKNKFPLRDPIITIMGHVDHGKTTLLDYIRKAKVAEGEAGGITQHIGAYSVKVKDSNITFLDTPGHAAFGAIRERGANVTDIVVLVVAADDGVMPQTKESIRFCQTAGVPVIVAVNKMDKESANPDRVKQELMEFNITPEEWGGDTQFCPISALKGEGVDELLEAIALQAEVLELRADDKGRAEGVVIESKVEQGRGAVATVLIQKGTLKKGDSIVVGETFGRARSLMDFSGKDLKKAGPSVPVQILGLSGVASPGDKLDTVKNEREAKKIVDNREYERKQNEVSPAKKMMSLEDFLEDSQGEGGKKVLKLIIRSDVNGSYEAIKNSLLALGNDEVGVDIIGGGVGAISDSDVSLAAEANGYIIGFNMRPITSARRLAEDKGVDIKTYSIIYEVIDDIKMALEGMLEPEHVEKYIGRAEVRETFNIPKIGTIAGSAVIDGKIARGCNIRLLRGGKILHDGRLATLKRFKDEVKEVKNGYECGIALENYQDIQKEDIFEAYMLEEKKRKLESTSETTF